jgi:hypothetical protein
MSKRTFGAEAPTLRGRRVAVDGRPGVVAEHRRGKRSIWPPDDVVVVRLAGGHTVEAGLAELQDSCSARSAAARESILASRSGAYTAGGSSTSTDLTERA